MKTLFTILFALGVLGTAHAINNIYVSPTGSGSSCTIGAPCSIATADAFAVGAAGTCTSADGLNSRTGVGLCIHVTTGTYTGPIHTTHSGTSGAYITWIADTRWGPFFSPMDWQEDGSFVAIVGMQGTDPAFNGFAFLLLSHANTNPPLPASFVELTNNYLHDFQTGSCGSFGVIGTSQGGTIGSIPNSDIKIVGNIIRHMGNYNFGVDHCVTDHGIYSSGQREILQNNIISGVSGWGIKRDAYASANCTQPGSGTAVQCSVGIIVNNTIFNNGGGINITELVDAGFLAFWDYNTVANNIIVNNGVDLPSPDRYGIDYFHVGNGTMGTSAHNLATNNLLYGNLPGDLAHHSAGCGTSASGVTPASGLAITGTDANGNAGGCPASASQTDSGGTAVTFTNFAADTNSAPASGYNYLNYQLTSPSHAVGTGTTTCAVAPGLSPCAPSLDILGHTRTNPPSMGAFDFASPIGPIETLTPTSPITFPNTLVGSCSAPTAITDTNTGNAPFTEVSQSITPLSPADFQFAGSSTCNVQTLNPGQSCFDNTKFCPTATGARTATYTNNTTAPNSPQTVTLQGTGIQPAATLSVSSLTFPGQSVNSSSAVQTFTLTNTGTAPLANSISISQTGPVEFTQTNNCPFSLGVGAFCTISVTFSPTTTGAFSASALSTDNAPGSPHTVALSGTGIQSNVTASPLSLVFADTFIGSTTVAQSFTITNTGLGPAVMNISVVGQFAQTNNCPASLAHSATCTVNVTFSPLSVGGQPGTVNITVPDGGTSAAVDLFGNGVTPTNGALIQGGVLFTGGVQILH